MTMTEIDPKALEHACLCAGRSVHHFDRMGDDLLLRASIVAHARAIERLEATEARHAAELREQAERFDAFRQEVSDAIKSCMLGPISEERLAPFILPAPDPLVEAIRSAMPKALVAHDTYDAIVLDVAAAVRKIGEAGE